MVQHTKHLKHLDSAQTKIVKCNYAVPKQKRKNFEVDITVLPIGCILINKVHWEMKQSGTHNFGIVLFGQVSMTGISFAYSPKLQCQGASVSSSKE